MAYCDKCGNYDDSHLLECGIEEKKYEQREDYQPDLYYYWDDYFDEIVEEIKGGQSVNDLNQEQIHEHDTKRTYKSSL